MVNKPMNFAGVQCGETLDGEGVLHSYDDNPSAVKRSKEFLFLYWHKHGKYHRLSGPASLTLRNGVVVERLFYVDGKVAQFNLLLSEKHRKMIEEKSCVHSDGSSFAIIKELVDCPDSDQDHPTKVYLAMRDGRQKIFLITC